MSLVPNWRKSWQWFSMHSFALSTLVSSSWLALPASVQAELGVNTLAVIIVLINFLGGLGRLIDQTPEATQ